ncbi:MAG: YfiM family protein [Burkholderiales bacterium]|nr:YfiM family protein [Burkholderiales bacterium]
MGAYSWNWGSSGFHFNNENWFGKNTGSGGSDKLGHAFTSYALTNALAERLQDKGRSPERAAMSAGLMTTALMLYVEAFDGLSGDHGFSYEDVIMNTLGTGFAYLRQTNPRLKSLVDYRMEYKPSGYKGFRPLSDYEGQKYLLALKFSGIKSLRDTPLKYFELQSGYYSRGFSKQARADGQTRTQQGFVGVGINLSELLFGTYDRDENKYKKWGRFAFEHVQVPYTYVRGTTD